MARLRYNLVSTTLGANLSNVATAVTFTSALTEGGVNIPTIVSPDIVVLNIGDEIVHLTAYSAGSVSGSILRGQGNIPAVSHLAGVSVRHVSTKDDFAAAAASFGSNPSLLIAASNSPTHYTAMADYVCDGTNDQVEINAAITALAGGGSFPASSRGTILFSPGSYSIDATINLGSADSNLIFQGIAPVTTDTTEPLASLERDQVSANFKMFTFPASGNNYYQFDSVSLVDFASYANTEPLFKFATGSNVKVNFTSCLLQNDQATGGSCITAVSAAQADITASRTSFWGAQSLNLSASALTLNLFRCDIYGATTGGFTATSLAASSRLKFVDCNLGTNEVSLNVSGSASPLPEVTIEGGSADGSIKILNALSARIRNMSWGHSGATSSGIRLESVTAGLIQGCVSTVHARHGIELVDCTGILVSGNDISGYSNLTDNTYSGVILSGTTSTCSIIGNKLRRASGNQPLYGIRIAGASCAYNTLKDNDIYTSSKTSGNEVSDLGASTSGHDVLVIAVGDETTDITTGVGKTTFQMPFAMCLTRVRASLNTVSSSGIPTFDINESGTTVLSTKLSIDENEKTSVTAATAAVITDSAIADDAIITIDIDVAGTGAKGPKVSMYGWRV